MNPIETCPRKCSDETSRLITLTHDTAPSATLMGRGWDDTDTCDVSRIVRCSIQGHLCIGSDCRSEQTAIAKGALLYLAQTQQRTPHVHSSASDQIWARWRPFQVHKGIQDASRTNHGRVPFTRVRAIETSVPCVIWWKPCNISRDVRTTLGLARTTLAP